MLHTYIQPLFMAILTSHRKINHSKNLYRYRLPYPASYPVKCIQYDDSELETWYDCSYIFTGNTFVLSGNIYILMHDRQYPKDNIHRAKKKRFIFFLLHISNLTVLSSFSLLTYVEITGWILFRGYKFIYNSTFTVTVLFNIPFSTKKNQN